MRSFTSYLTLNRLRYFAVAFAVAGTASLLGLLLPQKAAAACQAPNTDYGTAASTLSIPSSGTYRIWSRIKATNTVSNSFALEIDGTCYNVGGAGLSANTWKWVDYQGGSTGSKVQQTLNQGSHTIRMIGLQPGIRIDRIIATSDLSCTPVAASGDECNKPNDAIAPTVSITAPADNAKVGGSITINASASDNTGVAKVEFLLNNAPLDTDTTSPYSYQLDTSLFVNGDYTLSVRAFDAAGNNSSDQHTVTIQNGDQQAPTTPSGVTANAAGSSQINLGWAASTDNVGVTSYVIMRNGSPLTTVGAVTGYSDKNLMANTTYSYQIIAKDAAGNASAPSTATLATTTNPADTQAPTTPANLKAVVTSRSQINLGWVTSTDNVGVTSYEVYRQTGVSPAQKIATVTQTSFGDTTLKANTTYTYTIRARDAAGNVSGASSAASATTHNTKKNSQLIGTVRGTNGKPIPYAKVSLMIDGKPQTFTTTSKGTYDIYPLSGGRYTLMYSAKGYRSDVIDRNINPNARVNQNATLVKK